MSESSASQQSAFGFEITADQLAASRNELYVPDFELGSDGDTYATTVLNFFRELWDENGYAPIRAPHQEIMALPPRGDDPPLVLLSSYRGLTDGEVLDREPWLRHYKVQQARFETMDSEAAKAKQLAKLERILKHIPDLTGLQGIEEYRLVTPTSKSLPWKFRFHGERGLSVGQIYRLGPEANLYNLPTRQAGIPWNIYPSSRTGPPFLSVDGEAVPARSFESRQKAASTEECHDKLTLIVSLLKRRAITTSD